jgi:chemotaxis protein MotA
VVDKGTFSGVVVAVAGILLGLLLEGGNVGQILQPTAAMIVFGGTLGAVLVQFPLRSVIVAVRSLAHVFREPAVHTQALINLLVGFANKARRDGIVSLDSDLEAITDPFLKRSLMLAVDGTEPQELRSMMELELDQVAEEKDLIPAVFESAGGFSPTVGIIGAVLGLIQVMQHLENIEEVGKGIAVAFVATIYGVAAANLFLLPAAGKLRFRLQQQQTIHEMTLEGVIAIMEGTNPRMIEARLAAFLPEGARATATAPAEELSL